MTTTGKIDVRDVTVGFQTLRVAVKHGPEGPPPLLLFNGIGANWELARPFMGELAGRTVIIFDIPGIGKSPLPLLPYRPFVVAGLAARLVRKLGFRKVDVAGVSWGGGMAQEFAINHPRLCRRLVLAATSPGVLMVPGAPSVFLKLATPRRYTDREFMRRHAGAIYGGTVARDPKHINRHVEAMADTGRIGYLLQLAAMWGWTSLPWLPLLRQRTLVIMGTDDKLVPVINGRMLARLIPRGELELIDDGHLFIVSQPARTAAMIEDFLDRG